MTRNTPVLFRWWEQSRRDAYPLLWLNKNIDSLCWAISIWIVTFIGGTVCLASRYYWMALNPCLFCCWGVCALAVFDYCIAYVYVDSFRLSAVGRFLRILPSVIIQFGRKASFTRTHLAPQHIMNSLRNRASSRYIPYLDRMSICCWIAIRNVSTQRKSKPVWPKRNWAPHR